MSAKAKMHADAPDGGRASGASGASGKNAAAHVEVRARRGVFRRAGYTFGELAVRIPLAELSEQQMGQIMTEPALIAELL